MEIRDLFGDGSSEGDIRRTACLRCSMAPGGASVECMGRPADCPEVPDPDEAVVPVSPEATRLPREAVREAVRLGRDLRLDFEKGRKHTDPLLRETANLVRRLRTAGMTVTLAGLGSSERSRLARHENELASRE